jgi:ribonuclease BN (tRNA processing enzyme)
MKEKLIVLGSGTCVSGLYGEEKERWPPAYLIKGIGPELILLEASEGVRFRIQDAGYEYTKVSDVLISHTHPDHFNLVSFVQSIAIKGYWGGKKFKRGTINVYGPKGIKEAFWQIWKIKVGEHPDSIYGDLLTLNFVELGGGEAVDFYGSKLLAYDVFHAFGRIKSLTFRFETPQGVFVYLGDGGPSPGLDEAAQRANVFLCEVSADIGQDKSATSGHFNPYQAGEFAQKAGVKRLWLTHYSGRDSPGAMVKECQRAGFKGEILVVRDGDKLSPFE